VHEFRWSVPFKEDITKDDIQDFIDKRYIEILKEVAFFRNLRLVNVLEDTVGGNVDRCVFFNPVTRDVDFRVLDEKLGEQIAMDLEEAMEDFEGWKERNTLGIKQ